MKISVTSVINKNTFMLEGGIKNNIEWYMRCLERRARQACGYTKSSAKRHTVNLALQIVLGKSVCHGTVGKHSASEKYQTFTYLQH